LLGDVTLHISGNGLWEMAYLIVFATVITMWLQNRFQGDTAPTRAAVIFAMEPVVAGVLAYIVRNEQLGAVGLAGAACILTGLLLSEFSESIPLLKLLIVRGDGAI
jgi:drug/metabolite transporter (DMT)-like permease